MKRFKEIFLDSDISLASVILGIVLIVWGLVAVIKAPHDFAVFSSQMEVGSSLFWLLNHLGTGIGFIAVGYLKTPLVLSRLVGGYACLIWFWIASIRGYSNFTSGVSLNFAVIFMGALLAYRVTRNETNSRK